MNTVAKGCGIGCASCAGLILIIFLVALLMPTPHKKSAGPETLALAQQMQSYQFKRAEVFLQRFGSPSRYGSLSISGVPYRLFSYNCKDGHVSITINLNSVSIETINADGGIVTPNAPNDASANYEIRL